MDGHKICDGGLVMEILLSTMAFRFIRRDEPDSRSLKVEKEFTAIRSTKGITLARLAISS